MSTDTIDAADYIALADKKPNKYRNQPTVIDGHTFPSRAEGRRYEQLKMLLRAGEIRDLVLQPRFPIVVNGVKITRYTADFTYFDMRTATRVVEDVKSVATKTRAYVMRRKLLKALYGIDVTEVEA